MASRPDLRRPAEEDQPPPLYQSIYIREPSSTLFAPPLPAQYEFLRLGTPHSARKYRISFRHPAYADDDNTLFTLHAWDHADGGLHHGLAHTVCAIVADNRWDGYLSTTRQGSRVTAAWDEILPSSVVDYYFFVPEHDPSDPSSTTSPETPYQWPIVPTFQDWRFPSSLPEVWQRCAELQADSFQTIAPPSNLSSSIRARDCTCRVTGFRTGTEAAHLIPEHEMLWFLHNNMSEWNDNQSLDPENILRDLQNAVLLRSDIHKAFDERKFAFFPKSAHGLVVHMLEPTPDLGLLYHNTPVDLSQCCFNFLFARFAWSIFPSLSSFLSKPGRSRLVVRSTMGSSERIVEEVTNSAILSKKVGASRSNSPTKRNRITAQLDDQEDLESLGEIQVGASQTKRMRMADDVEDEEPTTIGGGLSAAVPTLGESDISISTEMTLVDHDRLPLDLERLRADALAKQRPPGFNPTRPPYDPRRPAREELELMGVEIIDDEEEEEWGEGMVGEIDVG